jgi:hypothetical protein
MHEIRMAAVIIDFDEIDMFGSIVSIAPNFDRRLISDAIKGGSGVRKPKP